MISRSVHLCLPWRWGIDINSVTALTLLAKILLLPVLRVTLKLIKILMSLLKLRLALAIRDGGY